MIEISGIDIRRILSVCGLVASLFCSAVTAQDGYVRQPAFDIIKYTIALELRDTTDVISGTTRIQALINQSNDTVLDLNLEDMQVVAVEWGPEAAAYSHQGSRLAVPLTREQAVGDTVEVTIKYQGRPSDGLIIRKNKFGRRTFFADNWPDRARHWFPSIDHPYDKAEVEYEISLPENYTVVANGRLQEVRQNGDLKTWRWVESNPIPTYCMVIGAADFQVTPAISDVPVPVRFYLFPEDAPLAQTIFGRVPEMMAFFEERFGAFPYEKLALVQSSTRFGGMENAGAIFLSESRIAEGLDLESIVAHEIAHQWFGDAVTIADWHHLWLSEGFASYGEALFYEFADGDEAFRQKMASKRQRYLTFAEQVSEAVLDTTVRNYMQLLTPSNYQKGAWVLHMLRHTIGDTAFFASLRRFYERYQHQTATTTEFQEVAESISSMSLGWFFHQWLRQPGYPELKIDWRWRAEEGEIELDIAQTQKEKPYRLPLEIAVGRRPEVKFTKWLEHRTESWTIPYASRPVKLIFDPEVKLLATIVSEETAK